VIRQLRAVWAVPPSAAALLALAVLLLPALLGGVSSARAEGTATHYNKENLAQYESQLNGGQVQSIVVNKRTRSLRITLKNGEHVFVKYAKRTGPKYYAAVKAHHVPLTFLTAAQAKAKQKKPAHKIRYIAGGALILVLAIVGAILYYNRGRQAARDGPAPTPRGEHPPSNGGV